MFAEEDVSGEDAPLEKLEHVARVLCTVPSGMSIEVCNLAMRVAQLTLLTKHRSTAGS